MQVALIDIGTSKGIRIPANVLKMFDSLKGFDLKVKDKQIILDTIESPRNGWAEKFKKTSNELLIDDSLDAKDWDEL
ncbi:MAG: AbrB/MazE/SpoVT family DNA-binding domain-containing protein [Campylobacterota bacterium]|nr:AbrB/MazE/SpoVT family DNA-binding domain-containing protein [Campylobacterota bacterium]